MLIFIFFHSNMGVSWFLSSIFYFLSLSRVSHFLGEKNREKQGNFKRNFRSSLRVTESYRCIVLAKKKKNSPYDERRLQETRFVRCTQNEVISVLTEPRVHHACNFDILHNFCRVDIGHDPSYPFSSLLFSPLPSLKTAYRCNRVTERRIPFSNEKTILQLSFENANAII